MKNITQEYVDFLNKIGAKGQIEINPSIERIKEIRKAMKRQQDIIDFRNGSDELSDIITW
jgi:hypothetical protein